MLKRSLLFLFFRLIILLQVSCGFHRAPRMNSEERRALKMIREIQEFEKTMGFTETDNFKKLSQNSEAYHMIVYHKKTVIPFSFRDPQLKIKLPGKKTGAENLESVKASLRSDGQDPDDYDFFFYPCEALSNGALITRQILNADIRRLAYVVIHEDWHDNISLPYHFEEASGELVGNVGMINFLSSRGQAEKDKLNKTLENELVMSLKINTYRQKLNLLLTQYTAKEIGEEELENGKDRLIKDAQRDLGWPDLSAAQLAFRHGYTYYFPLVYELFLATGSDIKKTVDIFKNMPFKDADISLPAEEYFKQSRENEIKAEIYIKRLIQELKQSPR